MTTSLEVGIPTSGNLQSAVMRQRLAESFALVISDPNAVVVEAFATQPFNALVLSTDGAFYGYDAADTTSAHDGSNVIVVSGRRYKRRGVVELNQTVLQSGLNTPPGSPALGASYIVGPAPTGLWAAQAKAVATFSARGWVFRTPFIGMLIYDVATAVFQFYSAAGAWVAGLPLGAITDGSIPPTKLADPYALLKVEDVRSGPPGSIPTAGTAYIVGASPTGAFVGHVNKVARSNGATYDFYPASEGSTVYKKDSGALFTFRSGVWGPTAPASSVRRTWIRTVPNVNLGTVSANTKEALDTVNITSAPGRVLRFTLHILSKTSGQSAQQNVGLAINLFVAPYKDADTNSIGQLVAMGGVTTNLQQVEAPNFNQDTTKRLDPPRVVMIGVVDSLPHDWHLDLRNNCSFAFNSVVYGTVQWTIEEIESS